MTEPVSSIVVKNGFANGFKPCLVLVLKLIGCSDGLAVLLSFHEHASGQDHAWANGVLCAGWPYYCLCLWLLWLPKLWTSCMAMPVVIPGLISPHPTTSDEQFSRRGWEPCIPGFRVVAATITHGSSPFESGRRPYRETPFHRMLVCRLPWVGVVDLSLS